MEIILKKNKLFLMLLFVGIISCDSNNRVFDEYKKLDNNSWDIKIPVEFDFSITDTISKNNLFLNLRNNNNYLYSNLYLITHLNFPNGRKIVDTLQYKMTDNEGNFLGTGFTEIKENKLFYKEQKAFPVSGQYNLKVWHAMRKNGEIESIKNLEGISDFGFRIEKIE
ncbi:MAG: gliding motility lipoprotein GldH [Flavobacteriaceae bacterium]